MPARKRRKPGGLVETTPRSAAQVFAERQQAAKDAQRQAAKVRREAQEREERRRQLTRDKDAAAARLKEVRRRGASGDARVEAEAAYRLALDALIRDEQGLPPASDEERAEVAAAPASVPEETEPSEDGPAGDTSEA